MNLMNVSLKDNYYLPDIQLSGRYHDEEHLLKDSFSDSRNIEIRVSTIQYVSETELFLNEVRQIVEKNLSNADFDFDAFAFEMKTSKSTLNRKFKKMLKVTSGEFTNTIRLKHARLMLINNVGSVGYVAHAVGYKNAKYFSRCFKSKFGILPTVLIKNKSEV